MTGDPIPVTVDELEELFQKVKNWGRWGPDDQRGALNLITAEKRKQAVALAREGVVVSCGLPLATQPGPDNSSPVRHVMTRAGDTDDGKTHIPGVAGSAADYFAMYMHGPANTHIDALCHIFHSGRMYNDFPSSMVTSRGASAESIEVAKDGVLSRGVLLDIPYVKGRSWLEPGEAIYVEDLEEAEKAENVRVEEGDILLIRTGRHRRRREVAMWDLLQGTPGLHVSCVPWLHERGVAVLGGDNFSDVVPKGEEWGMMPVHRTVIPAMGLHLIDNCWLDDLSEACAQRNRWEFLFVLAPLKVLKGTSSPINPLAML